MNISITINDPKTRKALCDLIQEVEAIDAHNKDLESRLNDAMAVIRQIEPSYNVVSAMAEIKRMKRELNQLRGETAQ
jgi:predicted  nucleic acid-binding Zn-ribbon protein